MPGDELTVTAQVRTHLRGENLAAAMRAGFANTATEAVGLDFTVSVLDDTGTVVAGPAALDEFIEVPGLVGDNVGIMASWYVAVGVSVTGNVHWVHELTAGAAGTRTNWTGGDLVLELEQVRTGQGFATVSSP